MNELELIKSMVKDFSRCPVQTNNLFQSDAEIIQIGNTKMAFTVDTLVDEIDLGIYTDLYEIGYIAVMATAADIAACGAKLTGVMVTVELPRQLHRDDIEILYKGIHGACDINKTYLLGGDTNWSDRLRVGVVGIGSYQETEPVMRTGINVGDLLFISGKMGGGNANALNRLMLSGKYPKSILPRAICNLSKLHSSYATACIDTSDGFFAALYNLGLVNEVNFEITVPVTEMLERISKKIASDTKVPFEFLLAGPVGEYELVFTIPLNQKTSFLEDAKKLGQEVIECGIATQRIKSGIKLTIDQKVIPLDEIIDGQQEAGSDIEMVIDNLVKHEIS